MHSVVPTKGVKFKYVIGEKVLCYEPDPAKAKVLYESKVLDLVAGQESNGRRRPEYLVHFFGWSSSWDRCVREDWVLPLTDENRELQRRLAEEAKIYLKGKSRIPPLFKETLAKNNKTKAKEKPEIPSEPDSSESSEDETEKEVVIHIPEVLKSQLEEDWLCITKKNKLVEIPCYPNVVAILEGFVKHSAAKMFCESPTRNGKQFTPEDVQDKLCLYKETVDGLRVSFDFTLPHLLLYGQEKKQHYSHCSTARPHRDHHEIATTSLKVEPPSSDPEYSTDWDPQPELPVIVIKQEPPSPESPPKRGRPRLQKNMPNQINNSTVIERTAMYNPVLEASANSSPVVKRNAHRVAVFKTTAIYNPAVQATAICNPVIETIPNISPFVEATTMYNPVVHTRKNMPKKTNTNSNPIFGTMTNSSRSVEVSAMYNPVVEAVANSSLRKALRNRDNASDSLVAKATTSRNREGKPNAKKNSDASRSANLKEQMIQKRKKGRPKSLPTRVLRSSSHVPVKGSRLPMRKKTAVCKKTASKRKQTKSVSCPLPIVIKTEPASSPPREDRITRRGSVQARIAMENHTTVRNKFWAPTEQFSNLLTNKPEPSSFEDRITRSVQSRFEMDNLFMVPTLQASTPFRPPFITDMPLPSPPGSGSSGGIHRLTELLRDAHGWRVIPECHWAIVPAEPSLIYGAQHLLRLFVKLPDLISKMRIPNRKLQPLLDILNQFLVYMLEQKSQLFPPSAYVDCPSDK